MVRCKGAQRRGKVRLSEGVMVIFGGNEGSYLINLCLPPMMFLFSIHG
jgi:hypothetical protein